MSDTPENPPLPTKQEFRVGPDYVIIQGEVAHIFAWREIPDWSVREFCRFPIFLLGQKYFLRLREPADPPYAMHYELAPWPPDLHEQSTRSYTYDERLVAGRDWSARADRGAGIMRGLLLPFYPLLGFFWSGVKRRALEPLGFATSSITAASTFLEFLLAVLQAAFLGWLGGGIVSQLQLIGERSWLSWFLDAGVLLVLAMDCAVRYHKILRGDETPDGFLEWLLRK